ncbi:MAG: tRNA uridine-5-carboxymethylaminomethyl(34) synthesis GTPase MnmE [Pseudomonadota bacterium]
MSSSDTIVALASGSLPSAIALLRVSGPAVGDLTENYLRCGCLQHRQATITTLRDADGQVIDEVVATLFVSPKSYTGEDVLELGLHGGRAVVARALDVLTAPDGVRIARPGEFTRRAVLSGKLDLVEAEGVADLVDAETEAQRKLALAQLSGGASEIINAWHAQLIEVMALVEVAVDFPDEEEAPHETGSAVEERVNRLIAALEEALLRARRGMQVRDGHAIAIVGAPNAGKSTLLNKLAQRDVAIVSDTPGTTRDVIEIRLNLNGRLVRLQDTAGIRASRDAIENEGIRRARNAASEADLVIAVYDRSEHKDLPPDLLSLGPDLVVANKVDLIGPAEDVSRETLSVSALSGEGMDGLLEAIVALIEGDQTDRADPIITRERHLAAITAAHGSLLNARANIHGALGAELVAEDIRLAGRALQELLGRVDVEDVLGSIFSSFCIGK